MRPDSSQHGAKSPSTDAATPVLETDWTAQTWVSATSDRYLKNFVEIWIAFSIAVWIFQAIYRPLTHYTGWLMLASGLSARLAISVGRTKLARHLFLLPLCLSSVIAPIMVSGVRTPLMLHIPLFIFMTGWMLGRRTMTLVTAFFVVSIGLLWLSEVNGWLVFTAPIRQPEVWATTLAGDAVIAASAVWTLIANYENNFGVEQGLRRQLSDALNRAEETNLHLLDAIKFNETVIISSPLAMGIYAANGQCVLANDAYAELVGATRETLQSQNFHTIKAWQESGPLDDCLQALAENTPKRREIRLARPFGKELWVEYVILPTYLKGEPHLLIQLFNMTERKLGQQHLEHVILKQKAILENQLVGIVTVRNRSILWANPAFEQMFGYTSDELVGASVRHNYPSDDAYLAVGNDAYPTVLAGKTYRSEIEYVRKDGERLWANVSGTMLNQETGETLWCFVEITDRIIAEKALRESEGKHKALISAIPDLIFTNRRDGTYLTIHAPDIRLLPAPPAMLVDRTIEEVWPKPIADILMTGLETVLDTGAVQDVRYALQLGRGEERHFEARLAPYADGTVISLVRDITERERERRARELERTVRLTDRLQLTEAELRESEQRLALAAEVARLGVWARDLVHSDEVWASSQWRALFGFTASEHLDLALILQRVHPADRAMVSQSLEDAVRSAGHYEVTFRIEPPEEKLRWVASRGSVETDRSGRPVLMRGVTLDVTERKLAELEIEQKRVEVTYLSRVATLGELSGAMAHELNQPLTAIGINAQIAQQILEDDQVDLDELRDILREIVDEDQRAGDIILRLRKLFGKGEMAQQSVDINGLVTQVARILRNDLINQEVTLSTNFVLEPLVASADPVQIQQVLINLVMNACDAMQSLDLAERFIVVRTVLAGSGVIQVSVVDQGTGISSENASQLFEPFFTTKGRGMGLGLSISKNIVAAHGGRLWCENNPTRGASFHFTLPLASAGGA